ncbi:MAG: hypothetical protein LBF84_01505 [Holosporales bacterium]|jgi:hypothetical protein|nr:hypothetical protein [Holosporales bacterium]
MKITSVIFVSLLPLSNITSVVGHAGQYSELLSMVPSAVGSMFGSNFGVDGTSIAITTVAVRVGDLIDVNPRVVQFSTLTICSLFKPFGMPNVAALMAAQCVTPLVYYGLRPYAANLYDSLLAWYKGEQPVARPQNAPQGLFGRIGNVFRGAGNAAVNFVTDQANNVQKQIIVDTITAAGAAVVVNCGVKLGMKVAKGFFCGE